MQGPTTMESHDTPIPTVGNDRETTHQNLVIDEAWETACPVVDTYRGIVTVRMMG